MKDEPMSLSVLADALRFAIEEQQFRLYHWTDDDDETRADRQADIDAWQGFLNMVPALDRTVENAETLGLYQTAPTAVEPAHTDHPGRHWDRTCPACAIEPGMRHPNIQQLTWRLARL